MKASQFGNRSLTLLFLMLAHIDKANGECIFLEGIDCTIQAVKPEQCRGF
jgi:Fe-S-cluster containining protein